MNTITLPRAGGRLRAAAGLLIRGPVRAMVRDRVVMVFALSLLALGVLDAAQLSVSVGFVAGALIGYRAVSSCSRWPSPRSRRRAVRTA